MDSAKHATSALPVLEGTSRAQEDSRVDLERLVVVVRGFHALAWRTLRRCGVSDSRVDEAVSRVFDVVSRRLGVIEEGREAAFVVQTSVRVASEFRRAEKRRTRFERPMMTDDDAVSLAPSPEDALAESRARALLDAVLDTLAEDVRAVFVLHELEGWTAAAIAEALSIPPGTAASRLRRARQQFEEEAARVRKRLATTNGDFR
jgi:RNA polymerase sigma-70 factor (ECF subfamily)